MMQNLFLRRLLSTDLTAPLSQTGIAVLRVVTGLLMATLHGWHKGRWSVDRRAQMSAVTDSRKS